MFKVRIVFILVFKYLCLSSSHWINREDYRAFHNGRFIRMNAWIVRYEKPYNPPYSFNGKAIHNKTSTKHIDLLILWSKLSYDTLISKYEFKNTQVRHKGFGRDAHPPRPTHSAHNRLVWFDAEFKRKGVSLW